MKHQLTYQKQQVLKINNRPLSLQRFLNDCYVEHNIGTLYNLVSNTDHEIGIIVDADPVKGWSIKDPGPFVIDNDAKRENVYLKVDRFRDGE